MLACSVLLAIFMAARIFHDLAQAEGRGDSAFYICIPIKQAQSGHCDHLCSVF